MKTYLKHSTSSLFIVASILFCFLNAIDSFSQTTYYSRNNNGSFTTAGTWSTTSHTGGAALFPPGAGDIVRIGAGHNINVNSSIVPINIGSIEINDNGAGGTLTFGNGGTNTTFNVSGNILINSGGTLRSGNTAGTAHTLNLAGDLTNNGTVNMRNGTATNQTIAFNGSATQDIAGTGTFTFNNVTIAGSAGNVNVNSSILINGAANALTFSANRLLNVSETSNVTLGATATVAGANASRYIQLDGETGAASQLIKMNTGTAGQWAILYPIGSGGFYTPMDLSVGGVNITNNPTNGSTLSVKAIYNASIQGHLRRTFRLIVSANAVATTFAGPRFYYNQGGDVSGGDSETNYSTLWYLNSSTGTGAGSWTSVGGSVTTASDYFTPALGAPQNTLITGTYYFTIGSSTAYPNTWYSYQSGVWSNWENWTLDPSGTTLVNGLNLPPQPGDAIVILNGLIITNDVSGQVASSTTINSGGTLDMAATNGNTLGTVNGEGLLRVQGVMLPNGSYTSFVLTTGGTIEYYNTGGTIDASQTTTYNNLIFSNSSTSTDATFVTTSNVIVNGSMNITQTGVGRNVTWQINNAAIIPLAMTIHGDMTISTNARIRVGTGTNGTPHTLMLNGNVTNNGSVRFFNDAGAVNDTNYANGNVYTAAAVGNVVDVTFGGLTSKTLICNGATDFYRFILSKGTGQQAVLTVNSTAASNLRLYGPNNLGSGPIPNVASTSSLNALQILNGTLELTGTLTIPRLSSDNNALPVGNNYLCIPQNGALWLNSAGIDITVANNNAGNDDCRILINGLLRVSNGILRGGYGRGLGAGTGGTFIVEGGQVDIWQYRPLVGSVDVVYIQSDGVVNVGTTGYNLTPDLDGMTDGFSDGYARFSLASPTSTFQMSGGTLNIGTPSVNSATTGAQGLDIQSAVGKFSVTGGTINAYIPTAGNDFGINTTAPLYNLTIWKESLGSPNRATIRQSITILGDLTLAATNNPALYCNNNDVTIGRHFTVSAGTNVYSGTTGTPAGSNTFTFNGTAAQTWTYSGTINNLNSVVMNKSAGILSLSGSGTLPNITNLTLTKGTLNDGGKVITVAGTAPTISNSAIHVTSIATGGIVVNGPTAIAGNNGIFGNLTISTNGTVVTSGDHTVTNNLRLASANTTLNIQSYSLTVLGNIYDAATGTNTAGFGTTKRIQTAGLRNDAGLTRQGSAGDLLFPIGVTGTTAYTPATINVVATTHGRITVRPVSGAHPNLPGASVGQSLLYYWRVGSTGYVIGGGGSVTHKSYTYGTNTLIQGTAANYRVARYDAASFAWTSAFPHTASGTVIRPATPTFNFGTNIDGEYTSGNIGSVSVAVFYSRQSGAWNVNTTWSATPCGGACGAALPAGATEGVNFPGPNNPVVIGNASNNHTVTVDANNRTSGSLYIETGSTLDCNTRTGLNFGPNTTDGVTGRGTLRINSTVFPGGDFTNFLGMNGGTVEWYGVTKTLPSVGPAPNNLVLDNYYNLKINPNAGQTLTMPSSNLTIFNDLTVNDDGNGGTVQTDNATSRTLTFNGKVTIANGVFNIRTNGGNTVLSTINLMSPVDSLTVDAGASFGVLAGGTATHTLTSYGHIVNHGTINFRNGSSVNVTFRGATDNNFTGTNGAASTTLNFLTIDKGIGQVNTLTLDVAGAMPAPPNAWLILQNGTMIFANNLTFTLQGNATTYSIPAAAKLKVQSGTVNILSNANDAADLLLSGGLEVAGTGTVAVGSAGGDVNNDIEYASSGLPSITVSGGTLTVNGAIRRATSTLSGSLVYNQTGGTVTVAGRDCDSNNTRGVFEIERNAGSTFNMSGGTLSVQRSTSGASFADLYINPENSNVSGGTIQLGMGTNTAVTSPLSVNIVPAIYNFSLLGTTTAQTVNMRSSELSSLGTLTVNNNTTLQTNALNVNIGGDLDILGTGIYNGTISGGNTTTFNGSGPQAGALTAGSTFQNITINKSANTATLNGNSTINDLSILNGVLSVTNTLDINGNIISNSTQTGAGTLNFSGASTTHTITSSNGSFGNLSLGGSAATKTINVAGNMSITGTLNFTASGTSRYLNIGSNKLTFSQTAPNVSNAGATRFIKTNGVASDLGVVKDWAAAAARTFVYAVGTRTNYTPVSMTLTVSSPGTYTVIAVDDQHPTATAIGEQILNYYWIGIRGSGLAYSTTGSHSYQFPTALIGGSGGTLVPAHLDALKLVGWTTTAHGGTSASAPPNTTITFNNLLNINLPGTGALPANPQVEFHYTAGTNTAMTATLPNPVTPVYSRLELAGTVGDLSVGGNWNLASNWTTSSTGIGGTIQTNVPTGRPVVIVTGSRINMNVAGLRAFTTQINGLLVMQNTTGHNLGNMSGTGTLRASTSTLPAGNYTTFVSAAGGTIEYLPTADINMNSRSEYNNVLISGNNVVSATNVNLTLNGTLTIGANATLNNTTFNRNLSIGGNIANAGTLLQGTGTINLSGNMSNTGTYNQSSATTNVGGNWSNTGTYNQGTGSVNFNGSGPQDISGTNIFYNLGMSKSAGNVTLNNPVDVTNVLTLTSGIIVSSATSPLILATTASSSVGNANSFVSGPILKTFNGSFTFPVGSHTVNRYRPATVSATSGIDTWTVEYVGNNPTAQGYFNTSFNTAAPANLGKVSQFEYWNVSRSGATTAALSLTYNTGSYLVNPTNIGNVANLKVVRWDGAQWDVPPGGGTFSQSGSNVTGTVTVSIVSTFSPFTFGSTDPDSPLPITLLNFNARLNNAQVDLTWATAQEIDNHYFVVEKTTDLETFKEVGRRDGSGTTKNEQRYSLIDSYPSQGRSYYRLKQVDFNGKFTYSPVRVIDYDGPIYETMTVYPNPLTLNHHDLQLQIEGIKETGSIPVKIFNLQGQVIFEKTFEVTPGPFMQTISFVNRPGAGVYIIKAGPTLLLTQKIVVE